MKRIVILLAAITLLSSCGDDSTPEGAALELGFDDPVYRGFLLRVFSPYTTSYTANLNVR